MSLLTAEYRLVRAGGLAAAGLACWYWLRPGGGLGRALIRGSGWVLRRWLGLDTGPIPVDLSAGSPTCDAASLSDNASMRSSATESGTAIRRTQVHFCPDFWVRSRARSFTNIHQVSSPTPTSGPRIAMFRLSASMLTRTLLSMMAWWPRIAFAVSLPPVKATQSCGPT